MVCYLQIKMLNLAYFYKTKLEGFFVLFCSFGGGGPSVNPKLPFSIFNGNHCLIANTIWSYCNNLTQRKFVGICMVKKLIRGPSTKPSSSSLLIFRWCKRLVENRERAEKRVFQKKTSCTGFPLVRKQFKLPKGDSNCVPYFFSNNKHLIWVLHFVPAARLKVTPLPCFPVWSETEELLRKFRVKWMWMRKGRKKWVPEISPLVPRDRSERRQWGSAGAVPGPGLAHEGSGCQGTPRTLSCRGK